MSGESDPNGKGLHEPGAKAHAVHGLRGEVRLLLGRGLRRSLRLRGHRAMFYETSPMRCAMTWL